MLKIKIRDREISKGQLLSADIADNSIYGKSPKNSEMNNSNISRVQNTMHLLQPKSPSNNQISFDAMSASVSSQKPYKPLENSSFMKYSQRNNTNKRQSILHAMKIIKKDKLKERKLEYAKQFNLDTLSKILRAQCKKYAQQWADQISSRKFKKLNDMHYQKIGDIATANYYFYDNNSKKQTELFSNRVMNNTLVLGEKILNKIPLISPSHWLKISWDILVILACVVLFFYIPISISTNYHLDDLMPIIFAARMVSNKEETWMIFKELYDLSWEIQYLYALYFFVLTMCTVGYGDLLPKSNFEVALCIFTMLFACGVFAHSINTIGVIFNIMREEQNQIQKKIATINEFMHTKKISFKLQYQVREYLVYYWKEDKRSQASLEKDIIFNSLSGELKQQLLLDANRIILDEQNVLNQNFSQKFMKNCVSIIQEQRYQPDSIIQNQFEDMDDTCLYFIEQGCVELFNEIHKQGKQIEYRSLKTLNSGCFGIHSFFTGQNEKFKIRTLEFTRLLVINKRDFDQLIKEFERDYELYIYMAHQIQFSKDATKIGQPCICCNSKQHDFTSCNLIHPVFDKYCISKKYNKNVKQLSRNYNRLKIKEKNSLKIQNECAEIANQFQEDNDDYLYDQTWLISSASSIISEIEEQDSEFESSEDQISQNQSYIYPNEVQDNPISPFMQHTLHIHKIIEDDQDLVGSQVDQTQKKQSSETSRENSSSNFGHKKINSPKSDRTKKSDYSHASRNKQKNVKINQINCSQQKNNTKINGNNKAHQNGVTPIITDEIIEKQDFQNNPQKRIESNDESDQSQINLEKSIMVSRNSLEDFQEKQQKQSPIKSALKNNSAKKEIIQDNNNNNLAQNQAAKGIHFQKQDSGLLNLEIQKNTEDNSPKTLTRLDFSNIQTQEIFIRPSFPSKDKLGGKSSPSRRKMQTQTEKEIRQSKKYIKQLIEENVKYVQPGIQSRNSEFNMNLNTQLLEQCQKKLSLQGILTNEQVISSPKQHSYSTRNHYTQERDQIIEKKAPNSLSYIPLASPRNLGQGGLQNINLFKDTQQQPQQQTSKNHQSMSSLRKSKRIHSNLTDQQRQSFSRNSKRCFSEQSKMSGKTQQLEGNQQNFFQHIQYKKQQSQGDQKFSHTKIESFTDSTPKTADYKPKKSWDQCSNDQIKNLKKQNSLVQNQTSFQQKRRESFHNTITSLRQQAQINQQNMNQLQQMVHQSAGGQPSKDPLNKILQLMTQILSQQQTNGTAVQSQQVQNQVLEIEKKRNRRASVKGVLNLFNNKLAEIPDGGNRTSFKSTAIPTQISQQQELAQQRQQLNVILDQGIHGLAPRQSNISNNDVEQGQTTTQKEILRLYKTQRSNLITQHVETGFDAQKIYKIYYPRYNCINRIQKYERWIIQNRKFILKSELQKEYLKMKLKQKKLQQRQGSYISLEHGTDWDSQTDASEKMSQKQQMNISKIKSKTIQALQQALKEKKRGSLLAPKLFEQNNNQKSPNKQKRLSLTNPQIVQSNDPKIIISQIGETMNKASPSSMQSFSPKKQKVNKVMASSYNIGSSNRNGLCSNEQIISEEDNLSEDNNLH